MRSTAEGTGSTAVIRSPPPGETGVSGAPAWPERGKVPLRTRRGNRVEHYRKCSSEELRFPRSWILTTTRPRSLPDGEGIWYT